MRMQKFFVPLCASVLAPFALVSSIGAQTPGEIIAYAGNTVEDYAGDGGPALNAEFYDLGSVVLDKSGNLYIADAGNSCVRKVTAATGIITDVAGQCNRAGLKGGYSGDGGLAVNAELGYPVGLVFDTAGNLYIADVNDEAVRKVEASTGVITTVAGNGTQGYSGDGGPATSAELDGPAYIAIDSSGNLYISDWYQNVVRKVTASTGIITTVAGKGGFESPGSYSGDGGPALDAVLYEPQGLACDSAGNLYIADQGGGVIRKVTVATGIITTLIGAGQFQDAQNITLDSAGNIYIPAASWNQIRKWTAATGVVTTIAGSGNGARGFSGNGGPAVNALLSGPYGIALDNAGNFYFSDAGNFQVRKVFAGGLVQSVSWIYSSHWNVLAGQSFEVGGGAYGSAGTAMGTMTFYEAQLVNGAPQNTVELGTAQLNSSGQATFSLSLPAGQYQLWTAYGGDPNYASSQSAPIVVGAGTQTAAAPYFTPAPGTYNYNLQVAINDATPNVNIIYTTDGSDPAPGHGNGYQGAIPVTANTTIKAVAVTPYSGTGSAIYADSPIATASYAINLPYEAPLPQGQWVSQTSSAQTGAGTTSCAGYLGDVGTYGTLGVPAADNVPGSRQPAAQWTDKNGNLWLFGGQSHVGTTCADTNELWMFNISTKEWTWMGGSSTYPTGYQPGVYGTLGQFAPGNVPGSRDYSIGWTDKSGNLWLFGGQGYDATGTQGYLNDVWEFNPSTRQWAWMGGSKLVNQRGAYGTLHVAQAGNIPGGRFGAAGWTDRNGNFWLFGGYAVDGTGAMGIINDLWEFNPATRQWAWMAGSHVINHYGVYGTLHVPSATNIPGARYLASAWVDASGNFWLFGGSGDGAPTTGGLMNDLWEFNPTNLNWTWAAGNSRVGTYFGTSYGFNNGSAGVYGTLGTPDPGNTPGSRSAASTWIDAQGNLWLYGGGGFDGAGNLGYLGDLWEWDRSKWLWAWMGGSNSVLSPQSVPGPRAGAGYWTDKNGNFWLFGGNFNQHNTLNDLYEYIAP